MKTPRLQMIAGGVAGIACLLLLAFTSLHLAAERTRLARQHLFGPDSGRAYVTYAEVALVVLLTLAMVSIAVAITGNLSLHRDSTRRLGESEERYRSLFVTMTEGLLVHDPDGRINESNPSACRILGAPAPELRGKRLSDLRPPLLGGDGAPLRDELGVAPLQAALQTTLRAGAPTSGLLGRRTADGKETWFLIHCQPLLPAAGGAPYAVLSTLVDITPQKQAEQELRAGERRLRAIIEDQTELICRLDTGWRLTFVNEAFCRFFEYPRSVLIGAEALPFILDKTGGDSPLLKLTREKPLHEGDLLIADKSQRSRWTRWTIRALFDEAGRLTEYQAVGRDIHELHRIRESLLALNEDLEVRVERRTGQLAAVNAQLRREIGEREAAQEELVQAKERAESANRAKTDFLAVMSHEIRTPMQSIMGFAELLRLTPLTQEQENHLAAIRSQNTVLMNIINDILDFTKIQSGRMALEHIPFKPVELAAEAVAGLQPLAARKGLQMEIRIDLQVPDCVLGDPNRVRQVLNNLLGNGIKFTAKGSVHLSVQVAARPAPDQAVLEFSVTDTGPGIAARDIPTLFEEFRRLDSSSTREHQGTGLGLAICRRLCRMMGGEIAIEEGRGPGRGSRFHFRLPFKIAAPAPPPNSAAAAAMDEPPFGGAGDASFAERHPLRILLAEDNEMARTVLFQYLAVFGYRAELAADGRSALEALGRREVDLLFMDVHMPRVDGIEATARIRGMSLARQPWIIGTTANVAHAERQKCFEAGMDDYLPKPILPEALRRALDRCLESRRN